MTQPMPPGDDRPLQSRVLDGDAMAWLAWSPTELPLDELLRHWREVLKARARERAPRALQAYVHFPYCEMHCGFCQYWHLVPKDRSQLDAFADYLVGLIGQYKAALGQLDVSHAYFGGGTPTALPAAHLERVLAAYTGFIRVEGQLTCEAHPATLDREKLALLHAAGVNRLSMGLQSFDEAVLRRVGRSNAAYATVSELVRDAQSRGMLVNLDLILGLPLQTRDGFSTDLQRCTELGSDTISVYRYQALRSMPGSPLAKLPFRDALSPRTIARALSEGYACPDLLRRGATQLAMFYNVRSPRLQRVGKHRLGELMKRVLLQRSSSSHYENLDAHDIHLLGIGPGSVSHLHGHAWYREVTTTNAAFHHGSGVYWGTRVTAADERNVALARSLSAGRWASLDQIEQATHDKLIKAEKSGVIELRSGGARFRHLSTPEQRSALLSTLLPARATSQEEIRDAALVSIRFRRRNDVTGELVTADSGSHASVQSQESDHERAPKALAFRQACALLGIFAAGDLLENIEGFDGAKVERLDRTEVHFRLEPEPRDVLRVQIEHLDDRRSYAQSTRFSIRYLTGLEQKQLSARERSFLDALCVALRRAEARVTPPETGALDQD